LTGRRATIASSGVGVVALLDPQRITSLRDPITTHLDQTGRRATITAGGVSGGWIALLARLNDAIATHCFGETRLTATVTADCVAVITLLAGLLGSIATRLNLTGRRTSVIVDRQAHATAGANRASVQRRASRVWRSGASAAATAIVALFNAFQDAVAAHRFQLTGR
jgi:hypothetical protein